MASMLLSRLQCASCVQVYDSHRHWRAAHGQLGHCRHLGFQSSPVTHQYVKPHPAMTSVQLARCVMSGQWVGAWQLFAGHRPRVHRLQQGAQVAAGTAADVHSSPVSTTCQHDAYNGTTSLNVFCLTGWLAGSWMHRVVAEELLPEEENMHSAHAG